MARQMVMVGFLQAQNLHQSSEFLASPAIARRFDVVRLLPGDRPHPGSGQVSLAFFDDRLAMPDRYGNDHAHTVEYGIRCVKMDPIVVLTVMGMATT